MPAATNPANEVSSSGTPEQKNINRQKREAICQDIILHVQSEVCTDDYKQRVDASMWRIVNFLPFLLVSETKIEECYTLMRYLAYNISTWLYTM